MGFDTNKLGLVQEHFAVLEIDLPAFTSLQTCTLVTIGGEGFYTPPSCDQTWDGVTFETYRFATPNTPLAFGKPPSSVGMPAGIINIPGPIYRVISGLSERVTKLKPGEGLAIVGTAQINLNDFVGDPGPVVITEAGTYFGKLNARNILVNKNARLVYYHENDDGIYEADDGLTKHYIIDSFVNNGKGAWTVRLKDELSKIQEDKNQFPKPTGGSLRLDADDSTSSIFVDAVTDWNQLSTPYIIKIGEEFMKVTAVTSNQSASALLTVSTRGADIVFTKTLSTTTASEHSIGDAIQICHTSDEENIATLLELIMVEASIPASVIPTSDWLAEIAEWHPTNKVNTLWHDPTSSKAVIKKILTDYLLDSWFDNEDREIRLTAISVWQESGSTVTDGKEITHDTFKSFPQDEERFSRAFIYYDQPNKVDNLSDVKNFRAVSIHFDAALEEPGFYGEPKTKQFENSHFIDTNAADLLVQRLVARFGNTPDKHRWVTEEKFLNFKTGDIVDVVTPEKQGFGGLPMGIRAQILSVQPNISNAGGRKYDVEALVFESAFADGTEFTISEDSTNINLHTFVGAPSQAVEVIIIIDGAVISSANFVIAAVTVGPFALGSKIILILKNNAEIQGGGGLGGTGGTSSQTPSFPPINGDGFDGFAGGLCLNTGKDIDIHLGGTILGHTALGILKAPGGGGGGERGQGVTFPIGGAGGGGGAGSVIGQGGPQGSSTIFGVGETGVGNGAGNPGDTSGNGGTGPSGAGDGGDWGQPGDPSAVGSIGGIAGSGLDIFGIAVVNIFTDGNTGRFINGGGDAPDSIT